MANSKGRVLVAMSGGVDSSVTAYLLQAEGYECIGATMKLYNNEDVNATGHTCCSLDDVEDARDVAFRLGIPHYVFDYSEEFEVEVMRPFVEEYEAGHTPNPCIECNRRMKFNRLLKRAEELGCDFIATGHYARIEQAGQSEPSGDAQIDSGSNAWAREYVPAGEGVRFTLRRGLDATKDQSYVLYSMTQDQLAHTLLPLGGFTKAHVREIAEQQGFINAQKHDSQDICFVPDGDYLGFLERYRGAAYKPGEIVDVQGKVLGQHKGAVAYTIGQRKGLCIGGAPEPYFVVGKNMTENKVVVGPRAALSSQGCEATSWNWVAAPLSPGETLRVEAKAHYRQRPIPAELSVSEDGTVRATYLELRQAAAPGQALVAYAGDAVVGGGTITRAF